MSKELIGSHSVHETLVRQTQIYAARIEELRAAANAKLTPYDIHWEDTVRRLMRQAAYVIEAANAAIDAIIVALAAARSA